MCGANLIVSTIRRHQRRPYSESVPAASQLLRIAGELRASGCCLGIKGFAGSRRIMNLNSGLGTAPRGTLLPSGKVRHIGTAGSAKDNIRTSGRQPGSRRP